MKIPCESFVKEILPAVRALLARDLLEKHNLTQREAARRLDMTQPAISQYKNRLRGRNAKKLESSKSISNKINDLGERIAKQDIQEEGFKSELCEICKKAREESILPDNVSSKSS